jgi:hypothetical protein
MLANANIKAHWLHPSQQPARKDHLRRGLISVRDVPAPAHVLALRQGFLGDIATRRAGLRSATRTDFFKPNTGAFRLVFQDCQELAPASIRHRAGELVVLDHPLDVQAFHNDPAITVNEFRRELVMLIAAGIGNFRVQARHPLFLLSAVSAPFFLTGEAALLYPQLLEDFLERLEGRFERASVIGNKTLKADIQPRPWLFTGLDLDIRQFTCRDNVPLLSLPLDGERFDRAFDWPVQIDPNQTNVLQTQLVYR